MSKTVIITGVSGQDGSYLADYLLELGEYNVLGVVRRSSKPNYSNLEDALRCSNFKLITGDLSDSHSLERIVQEYKPDYFINFAAQSFVGSSWDIPEQTFDVNATAVIRCLEAIRKHAPHCRFYNAGSSEEVGNVDYSPQDEKHPAKARSPYGASKVAARQIVKVYRESYGLYAIQGMLYNHESPRRGIEFVTQKIVQGVARIANAIENFQMFEPIELGNLDAKRDWSHAKDFVRGIWMMLNQDAKTNLYRKDIYVWGALEPINKPIPPEELYIENLNEYILSSGETHSIREFIELAFKRAGIQIENTSNWGGGVEYVIPSRGLTRDFSPVVVINPKFFRPAEVELLWGDSTRARTELGWKPEYSFEDLVNDMVDSALI